MPLVHTISITKCVRWSQIGHIPQKFFFVSSKTINKAFA